MDRLGWKITAALACAVFLCSCGSKERPKAQGAKSVEQGATGPELTLKAADDHPMDYPTTQGLVFMKHLVERWTGGRIKIQVYPGGQLGSEKETIEMTQLGALDINRVSTAPVAEFCKEMAVFSLPYLFKSRKHLWAVLDGPIGDELLKKLESAGLVGLAYYDAGARSFYTKKPVHSPADLKGKKIRVQKTRVMIDIVEALGASATPMAFEEVYSALRTGVIDGAENNLPSYESTRHFEVARFYCMDEHVMVPEVVLVSMKTWKKLPPSDQEILRKAAEASSLFERRLWLEREKKSLEIVKKAGCTIFHPDKAPFREATKKLYDKYGADLKGLIQRIRATKVEKE